jgi:ABC-type multidrug transport system permease subunit
MTEKQHRIDIAWILATLGLLGTIMVVFVHLITDQDPVSSIVYQLVGVSFILCGIFLALYSPPTEKVAA